MNFKQFTLVLILLTANLFTIAAQGDLIVTPNRVVFEGRKQKEVLNLINKSDKPATYTVSFVQRSMNEDGSFNIVETEDKDAPFADPFLRIYPRQVTLMPGEGQVVIIQVRKKPDMMEGEFRSHLYFRAEEKNNPLDNTIIEAPNAIDIKLTPIYGITIPIIIRNGNTSVVSTINDVKLIKNKDEMVVNFVLNRIGNSSSYGNFKVEYIPLKGKPIIVGELNGIAIYTNIKKRFISIALNKKYFNEINVQKGKLRVSYVSRNESLKQELFVEEFINLEN